MTKKLPTLGEVLGRKNDKPPPEYQAFAMNLALRCDQLKIPDRGRARILAIGTDVTKECARKWLTGSAIPSRRKMAILAAYLSLHRLQLEGWVDFSSELRS